MLAPAIYIEEVNLSFDGKNLLEQFSLQIPGEKCTCLLGPSGCGKSTLLGLISGNRDLLYSGKVRIADGDKSTNYIGWMGQSDLLLPWLTVTDNVLLGAKLRSEINPFLQEQAQHLLSEAGLGGMGHMLPHQLSGGMRQRVALLRTLMEERPVILMDEPFSALDALSRMRLQNLAAHMTRDKTVVMVTHDAMEALRLADTIVVLADRPVRIAKVIELHGDTPREADAPELLEQYPKLLKQLLGEVAG